MILKSVFLIKNVLTERQLTTRESRGVVFYGSDPCVVENNAILNISNFRMILDAFRVYILTLN